MTYEEITIDEFANAKWKGDTSVVSKEDIALIWMRYIEDAKMYDSSDFNKSSYIQLINNKYNSIKIAVSLQINFLDEFEEPYKDNFDLFKEHGYHLKWKGDKEDFLHQLLMVSKKQRKYVSILEGKIKELEEYRASKKQNKEELTDEQHRKRFLSMVFSLGKIGWNINLMTTKLEWLVVMICRQIEENEEQKAVIASKK